MSTALCLVLLLILLAGYRWQFWRPIKRGLVCPMYHHIGYAPKNDKQYTFTIPPAHFEKQLKLLKRSGFTCIGVTELLEAAQNGQSTIQKPRLLTFDDGNADNFTNLFPLLQKYQVKALIFLITDFIGKKPGYLTWDQVHQMHQSGLVEFGSHTNSHARLRQLSDEQILRELTKSKQMLEEKLGTPCRAFCYPFGSGGFDERVRPLVFQAGYQADFSTKRGINSWPWYATHTILRIFPRGGESLTDFYIQITRGKSRF